MSKIARSIWRCSSAGSRAKVGQARTASRAWLKKLLDRIRGPLEVAIDDLRQWFSLGVCAAPYAKPRASIIWASFSLATA